MSLATQIVHWPGKDSPMCNKHAQQAEQVAAAMGFSLSLTPCLDGTTICKNCENEEIKELEKMAE